MQPSSLPASIGDAAIVSAASARADHMHTADQLLGVGAGRRSGKLVDFPTLGTAKITIRGAAKANFDKNSRMYDFDSVSADTESCDWIDVDASGETTLAPGLYAIEAILTVKWPDKVMFWPNTTSSTWWHRPLLHLAEVKGASVSLEGGAPYNESDILAAGETALRKYGGGGVPSSLRGSYLIYEADGSTREKAWTGSYSTKLNVVGETGTIVERTEKLVDAISCLEETVLRPCFAISTTESSSNTCEVLNSDGTEFDAIVTIEKAL